MFATHLARLACGPIVSAVGRWPAESQQRARRNAMIASTALTRRRAEYQEVEEFLAAAAPDPGAAAPGGATAHG